MSLFVGAVTFGLFGAFLFLSSSGPDNAPPAPRADGDIYVMFSSPRARASVDFTVAENGDYTLDVTGTGADQFMLVYFGRRIDPNINDYDDADAHGSRSAVQGASVVGYTTVLRQCPGGIMRDHCDNLAGSWYLPTSSVGDVGPLLTALVGHESANLIDANYVGDISYFARGRVIPIETTANGKISGVTPRIWSPHTLTFCGASERGCASSPLRSLTIGNKNWYPARQMSDDITVSVDKTVEAGRESVVATDPQANGVSGSLDWRTNNAGAANGPNFFVLQTADFARGAQARLFFSGIFLSAAVGLLIAAVQELNARRGKG